MPENDSSAPMSRARRASSGPPVKQWKIVRPGYAGVGQDGERVVPGVAGVDHERQVAVVRQGDLFGEHPLLRLAR
jgi:hypothetical protein